MEGGNDDATLGDQNRLQDSMDSLDNEDNGNNNNNNNNNAPEEIRSLGDVPGNGANDNNVIAPSFDESFYNDEDL